MKVLFMTQVVPVPPTGGEKIRSYGLLRCLGQSGHEVYAVTPLSEHLHEAEEELPGVSFVSYLYEPAHSLPGQFAGYFRPDRRLTRLISGLIAEKKIDLAFIDYFFLGQYISFVRDHGIPVIYGTHNVQSKLRLQQPAKGFSERVVRLFSYIAQSLHERKYFRKADHLICVSGVDAEFYRKFLPQEKISVIPNFVDEAIYRPAAVKKDYIIMTGNFRSFQNFHGLQWFIDRVWDEDLGKATELYIVGRAADEALQRITGDRILHHVHSLAGREDVAGLIAESAAAVVPLWHGSGTRLKCIEAMALKTQLISTSIGAEGIDHKGSILVADSPELFRQLVLKTVRGEIDRTEPAHEIFEGNYSLKVNRERLDAIIRSVSSPEN
jgi:glycosyltransferase involved in cell wall biosynthesis